MTVNHDVTGSSPVGGVKISLYLWSVGQGVKTPPFHGGNTGSNPVRTILLKLGEPSFMLLRISSVGSSA